jgi:hypothetical protein
MHIFESNIDLCILSKHVFIFGALLLLFVSNYVNSCSWIRFQVTRFYIGSMVRKHAHSNSLLDCSISHLGRRSCF